MLGVRFRFHTPPPEVEVPLFVHTKTMGGTCLQASQIRAALPSNLSNYAFNAAARTLRKRYNLFRDDFTIPVPEVSCGSCPASSNAVPLVCHNGIISCFDCCAEGADFPDPTRWPRSPITPTASIHQGQCGFHPPLPVPFKYTGSPPSMLPTVPNKKNILETMREMGGPLQFSCLNARKTRNNVDELIEACNTYDQRVQEMPDNTYDMTREYGWQKDLGKPLVPLPMTWPPPPLVRPTNSRELVSISPLSVYKVFQDYLLSLSTSPLHIPSPHPLSSSQRHHHLARKPTMGPYKDGWKPYVVVRIHGLEYRASIDGNDYYYDRDGGPPYNSRTNAFWLPKKPPSDWAPSHRPNVVVDGDTFYHHVETALLWGARIDHDLVDGKSKPDAYAVTVFGGFLVCDHIRENMRWLWGVRDLQFTTNTNNLEKERVDRLGSL